MCSSVVECDFTPEMYCQLSRGISDIIQNSVLVTPVGPGNFINVTYICQKTVIKLSLAKIC